MSERGREREVKITRNSLTQRSDAIADNFCKYLVEGIHYSIHYTDAGCGGGGGVETTERGPQRFKYTTYCTLVNQTRACSWFHVCEVRL